VIGEIADLLWSERQTSESELNYLWSIVVGMRPQNPVQTMLAVELAANHKLLLENARRAANAGVLEERESAIQAHSKLSRNSAALAEAIHRLHCAQGQQVVHNVSITEGSHAIVGNVTQMRNEPPPTAARTVSDPELPSSESRPRERVPIKERVRARS